MSITQTYLDDNGYDYYGNAAEDTLVFFVREEETPAPEEHSDRSSEAITNVSNETVNGIPGGLSAETIATNTKTHAEAYKENGKDTSADFSVSRDNALADSEYSNAPISGSAAAPDSDTDADDFSDSVPKMAEMDAKQTDTERSTSADFKS